jgi:thioredoxin 1
MAKACKMVRTVSGKKANDLIGKKDGKVRLIQFMATWCGACQETKIQVDQENRELCHEGIETARVDVEKNEDLADTFGIEDLPTVVAIKNGKAIAQINGYEDAPAFVTLARKAAKK